MTAPTLEQVLKENAVLRKERDALKKRIDPQLVERALLGNLSMTSSTENAEPLQIGAMLSLVAVFDRRMPRELFIPMAEGVCALYGMLGRLAIAESILHMMERGTFTQEKIAEAAKELVAYAEVERKKILDTMKQVEQCPTSYDPVN